MSLRLVILTWHQVSNNINIFATSYRLGTSCPASAVYHWVRGLFTLPVRHSQGSPFPAFTTRCATAIGLGLAIVESICEKMTEPPPKKKNCVKRFYCFKCFSRSREFQKKSLHKSNPGKAVNLHIFKMAANETINVLLTVYGWFYTL